MGTMHPSLTIVNQTMTMKNLQHQNSILNKWLSFTFQGTIYGKSYTTLICYHPNPQGIGSCFISSSPSTTRENGAGVPAAAFRIRSQPPPLVPPRSTPYKAIRTQNTP